MVYVDHQALTKKSGGTYWPSMRDDVSEYMKTFLVCQQDKVGRYRLLGLFERSPYHKDHGDCLLDRGSAKKGSMVFLRRGAYLL